MKDILCQIGKKLKSLTLPSVSKDKKKMEKFYSANEIRNCLNYSGEIIGITY